MRTSIVDLEEIIDHELSWREREIAFAKKNLIQSIDAGPEFFQFAYRSFVALAYAHYEGAIKYCSSAALLFIRSTISAPSRCNPAMQNSLFAPRMRKMILQTSNDNLLEFLNNHRVHLDSIAFPDETCITEISNLDYYNITMISKMLGMRADVYLDYRSHIEQFVRERHKCAHGEKLLLGTSENSRQIYKKIIQIHDHVVVFTHAFLLDLLNSCASVEVTVDANDASGG